MHKYYFQLSLDENPSSDNQTKIQVTLYFEIEKNKQ